MFRYRSVSMGFGLEGVNGADQQQDVAGRAHRLAARRDRRRGRRHVRGTEPARGHAHRDGDIQLGCGHRAVPVGLRRQVADRHVRRADVTHRFHARKAYDTRVEVTDSLGHVTVAHVTVDLT